MAATQGHTQSLHTNALDEALALPTDFSARIARNTQLLLQQESGTTRPIDPWGGSYYVEWLTHQLAQRARAHLGEVAEHGGILLALNLAWIQKPAWFGLPAGPGPRRSRGDPAGPAGVPERRGLVAGVLDPAVPAGARAAGRGWSRTSSRGESPMRMAFVRLGETFRELRGYRQAFLMLLAFLIYNDGIQTIIKMATAYGTELGIGQSALIGAILLVQFVGIPCSFLFGMLAGRIGAKRALFLGLLAYTAISILGYYMKTAAHFYVLAGLVGMVQGGTQALSRSLFASMVPQHKSGEFFGFFSVFEKFAGIFGPLIFAGTIAATGSSRNAISQRHRVLRRRRGHPGVRGPGRGPAGGAGRGRRRSARG